MLYVNPLDPSLMRLEGMANKSGQEKVALQELEHFFLYMLLQEMRKTTDIAGTNEKGPEMDLYNEMLDDALSGEMSKSGQIGLAKQIEQQLRQAEMQQTLRASAGNKTRGAS